MIKKEIDMTPGQKLIADFHPTATFFVHHVTGERMVTILDHHTGTFKTRTVIEAGRRIMAFKRMNLSIRAAGVSYV
jgi:hypothetical protein